MGSSRFYAIKFSVNCFWNHFKCINKWFGFHDWRRLKCKYIMYLIILIMKKKVFGGYVSIRQAIYLIFGASMLVIFFIPLIVILLIKNIDVFSISNYVCIICFSKIDETNADKYFIYILNFFVRKEKFILEKGKKKMAITIIFILASICLILCYQYIFKKKE